MSTEKKSLLFGGSFDPVHKGHVHIIKAALELTDYERIIVMPASVSNFKQKTRGVSGQHRLAMLHLALDNIRAEGRQIIISDYEIRKGGVSYTYDTVKAVYQLFRVKGTLGFLMGDDLIQDLDKWYHYDELVRLVDFVCFTRLGSHPAAPAGASVRYYDIPPLVSSSSTVRQGDLDLTEDSVREYIIEHGLYGTGKDC